MVLLSQPDSFPALPLLLAFPVLWVLTLLAISVMGGWRTLAQYYLARGPFDGERFRMRSGRMRALMGYGSCLDLAANAEGLRLAVFPLFRPGHPPLFIPWRDIEVRPVKYFLFDETELTFRRAPGVPLRISHRLAGQLLAHRGAR